MIIGTLVEKMKEKLPELEDVVTFYNDGMVYYSSFPDQINTPILGKTLSNLIQNTMSVNELLLEFHDADHIQDKLRKIFFEIGGKTVLVLKLGEDSNIALFLAHKRIREIEIKCIKDDLALLEDMIDTTKDELKELGYAPRKE